MDVPKSPCSIQMDQPTNGSISIFIFLVRAAIKLKLYGGIPLILLAIFCWTANVSLGLWVAVGYQEGV